MVRVAFDVALAGDDAATRLDHVGDDALVDRIALPGACAGMAQDVILHRVRLKYEALAEGKRSADVLASILKSMA